VSNPHKRTRPRRSHPYNGGPQHPPCGRCGERHDGPCADVLPVNDDPWSEIGYHALVEADGTIHVNPPRTPRPNNSEIGPGVLGVDPPEATR
jgi:hypothetical protein